MAKVSSRAALAALACALAAAAAAAPARKVAPAAQLSADEIVEKNVAARGGLEAWRKIQTMLWVGHIESAHAPVPSLQFVLEQERPNKTHFEINAMGDRTLRVFDGLRGWKLRASHGRPEVTPYTLEEVRFEQVGPGIDGVLFDHTARGTSVEVAGIDEVDGRQAYHLILRTVTGETQQVWVDAKTFLEVRYDRSAPAAPVAPAAPAAAAPMAAAAAPRTVSVLYRDYQTFGNVKIPTVIETGGKAGNTPDRMVIEKVLLNPRFDARAFSDPSVRGNRMRAAGEQPALPPRRLPGASSPPAWLTPATPAGPKAPSPSAAPAAPAEGSPPRVGSPPPAASPPQTDSPRQPGSSSAPGQDRE